MSASQLLPERQQERGGPGFPCATGGDAGADGWKRCIHMEAVCLMNDPSPAVKVRLFARDALHVHVLNMNSWKGHRCLPGTAAGGGGAVRGGSIAFSLAQQRVPRLSPLAWCGSAEEAGCFLGKGQAPAAQPSAMLPHSRLFSGLSSGTF